MYFPVGKRRSQLVFEGRNVKEHHVWKCLQAAMLLPASLGLCINRFHEERASCGGCVIYLSSALLHTANDKSWWISSKGTEVDAFYFVHRFNSQLLLLLLFQCCVSWTHPTCLFSFTDWINIGLQSKHKQRTIVYIICIFLVLFYTQSCYTGKQFVINHRRELSLWETRPVKCCNVCHLALVQIEQIVNWGSQRTE